MRTNFERLTLKALDPSVVTEGIDTRSFSALTVDGTLHITGINRRPFLALPADACAIVQDASCFASVAPD